MQCNEIRGVLFRMSVAPRIPALHPGYRLSAGSVSCSILLADACRKVSQASTVRAVAGIIVDAKDDKASAFYKHFGFIPLQGQGDRMVLPASVFQTE